jgi:xanthine/CO dehydrogenase XdhC/CoxF family maturation factor
MSDNFTVKHYADTIKKYIEAGYAFDDMLGGQTKSGSKSLIMFHDVDHDISLCKNFLTSEKEYGICATYFLRLHAKNYNMLSRESIKIAHEILNCGGKIGLHYEPNFWDPADVGYEDHIKLEMEILSLAIGSRVEIFNLHEPARTGVSLESVMPQANRCHNSPYLNEYKYLSDSSCRWREGCFSRHVDRWGKLLVLTHPIWWYKACPAENY